MIPQMRDPPPVLRLLPRSHLDSATYRSFVRLLSHCLSTTTTRPPSPHGASSGGVDASSVPVPEPGADVGSREEGRWNPGEVASGRNGGLGVPVAVGLGGEGGVGGGGGVALGGYEENPMQDRIFELGQKDDEVRELVDKGSHLDRGDDGVRGSLSVGCQNGSFGSLRELGQGDKLVNDGGSNLLKDGKFGADIGTGCQNRTRDEVEDASFDSLRELGQGVQLLMVDDNNGFDLAKDDDLGLLEIQKEFSDCILELSSRVEEFLDDERQGDASEHCAPEKLQGEVEHVDVELFDSSDQTTILTGTYEHGKGQEGHGGSATIASHHDHVFKSQELFNEGNHKEPHSVMPEAEISCSVEESNYGNQQVACVNPVISGSGNSDETTMTNPLNVLNDDEWEEGEILGEFGDEIRVHSVKDTLTMGSTDNVDNDVHKPDSFTMKEDCIVGHDLARKNNDRNYSSNIVDYGDLYQIGHAFRGNKLTGLPENKKGSSRTKKNGGDKLLTSPKTGEGNGRKKNDECHVSFPEEASLSTDISEKFSIPNLQKESSLKDAEVMEKNKKKKGPLTEERKAKKKQAKKRKRAEQNRKLGIKRLKILPVLMPKKVIYCDFYLKGRCQKGDLCKFSHDTTPLTKSQPCKYFACQSCLKGSDCPFDHELWKYPCHNFMSKGTCSRGEECKFSHKIQVAEGSVESATNKVDTLRFTGMPDLGKQLNTSVSSFQVVKNSTANKKFSTPSSEQKHSVEQIARKPLTKVPKGIHFLSFGKHPSEEANKSDDKFLSGTPASGKQSNISISSSQAIKKSPTYTKCSTPNSELKQSVELIGKPQMNVPKGIHFLSFGENLPDKVKKSENKLFVKEFDDIEIQTQQDKVSGRLQTNEIPSSLSGPGSSSRSIKSDVTDATKILEEFLFCGDA